MTEKPAVGSVAHFALNADDIGAAQRFYAAVFGWRFAPWGPPGFFRIQRSDGSLPGPIGALQQRRDLVPGSPPLAELTVAVDDVDEACASCTAHGGRVLLEKTLIPGVGELAFLLDPSGIPIGAMRYLDDSSAVAETPRAAPPPTPDGA
jgi:predicted enzyme related to lactoylglutathione lyase